MIALATAACLAAGCATGQRREQTVGAAAAGSVGQWHAKALVEDKRQKKSATLVLDLVAENPDRLRMEVTNQLGIYLASFALNREQIEYLMVRDKLFVTGPASPKVLRDVISLPVDPKVIVALLFDSPFNSKEWDCDAESGARTKCENVRAQTAVRWQEREAGRRLVAVDTPNALMTLNIQDVQSKPEVKESTFDLEPPKGFQVRQLN